MPLPGPDDAQALARLSAAIDDLRAFRPLHRSRIGLVGAPSDWLVASVPSAEAVRRTWGPETVAFDLDGVLKAAAEAAGVFGALEDLAAGQRLAAVAVRCFDLVTRRGTSGCLVLAELNDRGTVAACEGDLASAVAMLWVRELLGTAQLARPRARRD